MVRSQLEKSIVFCNERNGMTASLAGHCTLSEGKQTISCPYLDIERSEVKEWHKTGVGTVTAECYGCNRNQQTKGLGIAKYIQ